MRGATVKETLYLASEHGRHSVFETQIARPPDRIFFADTMIFVVHDPTSFQLLYISCINKGNLPTYLIVKSSILWETSINISTDV